MRRAYTSPGTGSNCKLYVSSYCMCQVPTCLYRSQVVVFYKVSIRRPTVSLCQVTRPSGVPEQPNSGRR